MGPRSAVLLERQTCEIILERTSVAASIARHRSRRATTHHHRRASRSGRGDDTTARLLVGAAHILHGAVAVRSREIAPRGDGVASRVLRGGQ